MSWQAWDGEITVKWSSTVEPTSGKRSRTFEHSIPARWAALIALVVATMLGVTIPALADPGNPTATTRPDDQGDEHGQGQGQGSSQGGPNGQNRGNDPTDQTTVPSTTSVTNVTTTSTTSSPVSTPTPPISLPPTIPIEPPLWPPTLTDPLPPTFVVPIDHSSPTRPRILVCVA